MNKSRSVPDESSSLFPPVEKSSYFYDSDIKVVIKNRLLPPVIWNINSFIKYDKEVIEEVKQSWCSCEIGRCLRKVYPLTHTVALGFAPTSSPHQVLCGVCGSYIGHLYECLAVDLGTGDGLTTSEVCSGFIAACDEQIVFSSYGGEDYCTMHTGGGDDLFWSYPHELCECNYDALQLSAWCFLNLLLVLPIGTVGVLTWPAFLRTWSVTGYW